MRAAARAGTGGPGIGACGRANRQVCLCKVKYLVCLYTFWQCSHVQEDAATGAFHGCVGQGPAHCEPGKDSGTLARVHPGHSTSSWGTTNWLLSGRCGNTHSVNRGAPRHRREPAGPIHGYRTQALLAKRGERRRRVDCSEDGGFQAFAWKRDLATWQFRGKS